MVLLKVKITCQLEPYKVRCLLPSPFSSYSNYTDSLLLLKEIKMFGNNIIYRNFQGPFLVSFFVFMYPYLTCTQIHFYCIVISTTHSFEVELYSCSNVATYINFQCKPQIISNYILQFQLSSMHILEESSSGYLRFLKFIVKIACSM